MNTNPILYQKLDPIQVACLKTRIDTRDQIPPLFERLRLACGERHCAVMPWSSFTAGR